MGDTQKTVATIFGFVFLILGILGFIMPSPLFGLFHVNLLHNVIHLLTAVVFFFAVKGDWAKQCNKVIGVVYLLVAVLGLLGLLSFLHVGHGFVDADNWFHIVVGVVVGGVGWFSD